MGYLSAIPFLNHLLILLGLAIGSATDLKSREVPDWLNYGLAVAGIGLAAIASTLTSSYKPLLASVLGLTLGYLLGYLLFIFGQWGGGDAKMIMGLGALIGLDLFTLTAPFHANIPPLLLFVINTLLAGAVYGILWALGIGLRHRTAVWAAFKEAIRDPALRMIRIMITTTAALGLIMAALIHPPLFKLLLASLALGLLLLFHLWNLTKAVEKVCMHRNLTPAKLTEGDWVARDLWTARKTPQSLEHHLLAQQQRAFEERCSYDLRLRLFATLKLTSLAEKRTASLRRKMMLSSSSLIDSLASAYVHNQGVLGRLFPDQRSVAKAKTIIARCATTTSAALLSRAENELATHFPGKMPFRAFLREEHHFSLSEEYLAGPGDLGISKEQIERIKTLRLKEVPVKEGIPFVPSFLLAYLALLFWGNWPLLFL